MGLNRPKNLGAPGALPDGALRVLPLGGLGAIGRNMTLFEYDGKLLIVDCGVLFPDEHQPGVDVIIPDFTWIRDRLDKVDAIVLTHGHEDHIGGVPYLLRERPDIPLVGSRLTLAFIKSKLTEHRITPAEGATAADALERLVEDLRSSGSAENGGPGGQGGAGGPVGPGGAGGPGRQARQPAPGGQSPARRSTEDGA